MSSVSVVIRDYKTQIPGSLVGKMWVFPKIVATNAKEAEINWVISVGLIPAGTDLSKCDINDLKTFEKFLIDPSPYFDNKTDTPAWAFHKVDSWQTTMKNGKPGKIKASQPTIVMTGKSLKSINATNSFQQALRDALSLYNKKQQKSQEHTLDGRILFPPMLANKYEFDNPLVVKSESVFESKTKSKTESTKWVQRKYNGLRCMMCLGLSGNVIQYSRKAKEFNIKHLAEEVSAIFKKYPDIYLDGELFKAGMPLEDISGIARNSASVIKLDYIIYDLYVPSEPDMKYSGRLELLKSIFTKTTEYCKLTTTYEVHSEEEIGSLYRDFIKEGYEGAMVRLDEPYVHSYNDYHSNVLLKIKPTFDAEFKLIDYTEGTKGKGKGQIMFICETAEGKTFDVTPAMEIDKRTALYSKLQSTPGLFEKQLKGHMLVIEFDEYTKDKIPSRARTRFIFRKDDHTYAIEI